MNKMLVVYSSKYGSTKKYAGYIANELESDIQDAKNVSRNDLREYDKIIFAFPVYAGNVRSKKIIIKNIDVLSGKKVAILLNGMSPLDNEDYFKNLVETNFGKDIPNTFEIFQARGKIEYKKIGKFDGFIMKMMKNMISNKKEDELTSNDKKIIDTYGDVLDLESNEYILPLISYIKGE